MSDDSKFERYLQREVKDYRADEPAPADAMWSRIEGDVDRALRPTKRRGFPVRRGWLFTAAAVAASLIIGVAVGRWSGNVPASPKVGAPSAALAADDSARIADHARAATFAHLGEAEVFLTAVRADLRARRPDSELGDRTRELLARTRLLLDAQGGHSPQTGALLQDLELLLAEISALAASRRSVDLNLLNESMRQDDLLPRIRSTLPAPSAGT